MKYSVNIGDQIEKIDTQKKLGNAFNKTDLTNKTIVIYFYPKDDTPGCTVEACAFRDHLKELSHLGVQVIGVSPDSIDSHSRFIEKHQLNFPLLSDSDCALCQAFDVMHLEEVEGKEKRKLERTTFIIDSQGIIRWIERPVQVNGHVERVLAALQKLRSAS